MKSTTWHLGGRDGHKQQGEVEVLVRPACLRRWRAGWSRRGPPPWWPGWTMWGRCSRRGGGGGASRWHRRSAPAGGRSGRGCWRSGGLRRCMLGSRNETSWQPVHKVFVLYQNGFVHDYLFLFLSINDRISCYVVDIIRVDNSNIIWTKHGQKEDQDGPPYYC